MADTTVYNLLPDRTESEYLFLKLDIKKLNTNIEQYEKMMKTLTETLSKYELSFEHIKALLTATTANPFTAAGKLVDLSAETFKGGTVVGEEIVDGNIMAIISKELDEIFGKLNESIEAGEAGATAKDNTPPTHTFFLPLPNQLRSATSHNYVEDEMDPVEKLEGFKGYHALKIMPTVGKLSGLAGSKVADMMKQGFKEAVLKAKRANVAIDTNLISTYSGTNCRQFTLDFNIIAENQNMAVDIVNAIVNLKKIMAGRRTNGIVVQEFFGNFIVMSKGIGAKPNVEKADYINELLQINENSQFNISDINIVYGADGSLSTFRDGMPKFMTMSLTLIERRPIYNDEVTAKEEKSKK